MPSCPDSTAPVRLPRLLAASVLVALSFTGAAARADRTATYVPGTIAFSQNVTLRAPVTTRDGEPSLRVDVRGNCYVGGIRGVPAGVDLWRFDLNPASATFDPGMQNPTYLGQPDAFLPQDPEDPEAGGADGGGDIDISLSVPNHPDSIPVLTITSLALANISSAVSFDRGENFNLSPATAIAPADDRQWNESTGHNRVYLFYRAPIPASALFVQRSDDHGASYLNPGLVSANGTSPGYIDVDHGNGRVYVSHQNGTQGLVSRSTNNGMSWQTVTVDNTTGHGSLFDVVKVGDDGTVYLVWSDQQNIWLSHSTNGGASWAQKVRVNDNAVYKSNIMPWIEAGSDGRVCVVWYGSTSPVNNGSANWVVLFAQSLNGHSDTPTFAQQVISDHTIHGSNMSLMGLGGGNNRNLLDYFQVALDSQGAAVIAFTDDHNDFEGHVYVTRQLDGPSLKAAANGNGTVTPASPPPLPLQDFNLPEVTDFLHDATTGLLLPITTDNPFDILSIDYGCELGANGPMITATMKLSSLAVIPNGVQWRINLSADAPGASPGVPGLSDRGQQFFMRAGVDDNAVQAFVWGTASRADSGHVNYLERGTCDFGAFDQINGTVTMKVALAQLNAFANPDLAPGTLLSGLRGQTLEPGFEGPPGNRHPFRDHTRGGGTFTIPACGGVVAVPAALETPERSRFIAPPAPNPAAGDASVQFEVARAGFVELAVFDPSGRRVRTIQAGPMAAGRYTRRWDGRTDRFMNAAPGLYFFVLNTAEGVQSERVALLR
ncbi:MAG TPA: FlgD immunoglobulin-like domain containing protein [Candidatus Eisenbacteria bacterium]|nr:FlgD immunoglobulin-like domain containing protein [Candidatus Eisenbacteria bacterium]